MFGLNSLEDKVIAKKIGNFGIILTRRYLLYMALIVAAALSIYTFIIYEENAHKNSKNLNYTITNFENLSSIMAIWFCIFKILKIIFYIKWLTNNLFQARINYLLL